MTRNTVKPKITGEALDQAIEALGGDGIETGRRLIEEQQHFWIERQRARDSEARLRMPPEISDGRFVVVNSDRQARHHQLQRQRARTAQASGERFRVFAHRRFDVFEQRQRLENSAPS